MSNSADVTLFVLDEQAAETERLFTAAGYTSNLTTHGHGTPGLSAFHFAQVPDAYLRFIHTLQAAGIAYKVVWRTTDRLDAGNDTCRFTKDGEAIVKTLDKSDYSVSLDILEKAYRTEPTRGVLIALVEQMIEAATILPWDNQSEYGRLYRMNQLLHIQEANTRS